MTLVLIFMIYGGTLLLTSGIENISLTCTFQWVMNGAQGTPSCVNAPTTSAIGPQIAGVQASATPPGSVIITGNPFTQ